MYGPVLARPGFFVSPSKATPESSAPDSRSSRTRIGSAALRSTLRGGRARSPSRPQQRPTPCAETFHGTFHKEIVVIGSNKREVVHVKEIPFTSEEEVHKALSAA